MKIGKKSVIKIIVTASACIHGLANPAITLQPVDISASMGAIITNRVAATGAAPLSYQWNFNGNPLANQTNRSLILNNVQLTNAGLYQVVVSDSTGSLTSKVATLDVDATFTKIKNEDFLITSGNHSVCGWIDFDADGHEDLFQSVDGLVHLWRNNPGAKFSRVTSAQFRKISHLPSACWGDYDNDGRPDLIVTGFEEGAHLYKNLGNGSVTRTPFLVGFSQGCSWTDYDKDGFLDFFIGNGNQRNFLYRGSANGAFTAVSNPLVNTVTSPYGVAWADFNGDTFPDVFLAGYNGIFLFTNANGANFVQKNAGPVSSQSSSAFAGAWADYDNDGDLDLFVSNISGTDNPLYENVGNGSFLQETNSGITIPRSAYPVGAWGDYDNDGYLDLFVANGFSSLQKCFLFRNKGDGTFKKIETGSLVNESQPWIGCGWSDYNEDGHLDLYVQNHGGNNSLYHNNGNSNAWLRIKLTGSTSNRDAIGAKIRMRAMMGGKTITQFREVSPGDGGSGISLIAHFGVGDATTADSVQIEWPSGIIQELKNIPAKQMLRVSEPVHLKTSGPNSFEFKSWLGMAFDFEISTDLTNWKSFKSVTNTDGIVRYSDPELLIHSQTQSFFRVRSR